MYKNVFKVEVHCHLHGSVRLTTLHEFCTSSKGSLCDPSKGTLSECFRLFAQVHEAVNSEARVRRVVREALEDAVADNVVYLEMRTTPRELEKVSRTTYVQIVVDEINNSPHYAEKIMKNKVKVTLILSIDRAKNKADAWETLEIAKKFPDMVVGLDFSGNPSKGCFEDFVLIFREARNYGLKITVHTAEIADQTDTDAVLDFGPDRVGHFLCVSDAQYKRLRERDIPVELCLTSNAKTLQLDHVRDHPTLSRLVLEDRHRVSFNTDDPGIFGVTLSDELKLLTDEWGLSKAAVAELQVDAALMSFWLDKARLIDFLKSNN